MNESLQIPRQRPKALPEILERTHALGFAMASEKSVGALLRTLAASKPAGSFLELGTGTGIATSWILDGMDSASNLTSIDVDSRVQDVARVTLSADHRLTLITEDATVFLKRHPANGFDLVFADAMTGKYDSLEDALAAVKPGGFYVIDDMLPQPNWPEGHEEKVQALLAILAANQEFEMAPLTWASGVVVAVKKTC